jgi:aspartate racemase
MKSDPRSPKIGIIGGAGPMAGALLFQTIIQHCQEKYGAEADADFPYILLVSYPFADMLQNPSQTVTLQLQDCFKALAANEVDIAVIACNTLHAFLDPTTLCGVSLVHIIEETAAWVNQHDIAEVLVLCTNTSAQVQLHRRFMRCIYPDVDFQTYINTLILKILTGKQTQQDAELLAQKLNAREEKGVVLGCTELSLLNTQFPLRSNGLSKPMLVFDPNQIAADKLCSYIFNKTNKRFL